MLVVGANLTVDRTLHLPRLVPGSVQRPRQAIASAGGKAVNVCRAASAHGRRPLLLANLPGRLGGVAAEMLEAEGLDLIRVPTTGEIRSAIIILEDDLRTTVLNEPGPALLAADRDALLEALDAAARSEAAGDGVVVASGSLPPGDAATELYADVVRIAHARNTRIVLDAARDDLRLALHAEPDVITPNLSEALAVLGHHDATESVEPDIDEPRPAATDAALQLLGLGARAALVTVGRYGVAGASAQGTFWVDAPAVVEVNPIGAGDAFAAGLACALSGGATLVEATRVAVATGAASVASAVAGQVDRQLLDSLLQTVAAAEVVRR